MESSIEQLRRVTYHREMARYLVKDIAESKTRVIATREDGREVSGYMGTVDDVAIPARVWVEYDEPLPTPCSGVPNCVTNASMFTSAQLRLEGHSND